MFFFFLRNLFDKMSYEVIALKRVLVGITCSEYKDGERYMQATGEDYINAVVSAGGTPVMLPICQNAEIIKQQVESVDALLIIGGIDVNPLFYQQDCHFEQGESSYCRDKYEIELIQYAATLKKPILGICRGIQVINVAFGGTLYQDVKLAGNKIMQHTQKEKRSYPIHSIQIQEKSFLEGSLGKTFYVNSFHHQSIDKLAERFCVVATSHDGIIEAIEHIDLPIWAVQFHPEAMCKTYIQMQNIFNDFINRCQK